MNSPRYNYYQLPPSPSPVLRKIRSDPNLEPNIPKTSVTNEYYHKQTQKGKHLERKNPRLVYSNEQSQLPLSSLLQNKGKQSQICLQTMISELDKKRVSFGKQKSIKLEYQRTPKIGSIQRKNSILKSSKNKISRSNSILSSYTSLDKNIKSINRGQEIQSTLSQYRKALLQFESKRKQSKDIIYRGEKYTDKLFPPVHSSIFSANKQGKEIKVTRDIEWKRIPEVFKGKKLRLKKEKGQESSVQITSGVLDSQYIAQSFETIKQIDQFLAWTFSECTLSVFGIYCLKIFQNNAIKFIIIDDFIPVIKDEKSEYVPVSTRVTSINKSKPIEIWPFLLEKAYASYYCSYEAFRRGNAVDFIEELTGQHFKNISFLELMKIKNKEKLILIEKRQKETEGYSHVHLPQLLKRKGPKSDFKMLNYLVPNQIVSKLMTTKQSLKDRRHIFVKKIKVSQNIGLTALMLRQRDQKFYPTSSNKHEYVWIRALLLMVQYDGNYHYIDGKYSNAKSINFQAQLGAGTYYLLIMGEWPSSHRNQLSLIINSTTKQPLADMVIVTNQIYQEKERMLEKCCADLAQRKGVLEQMNKVTCCYRYICRKAGMVVENINNERISGQIVIERQWKNNTKVLYPFNAQFEGISRKRIEIMVPKEGQFTFVFLCFGGLQQKELDGFCFK